MVCPYSGNTHMHARTRTAKVCTFMWWRRAYTAGRAAVGHTHAQPQPQRTHSAHTALSHGTVPRALTAVIFAASVTAASGTCAHSTVMVRAPRRCTATTQLGCMPLRHCATRHCASPSTICLCT